MKEYTLFLDESCDNEKDLFCIAGCIIKNEDMPALDVGIEKVKRAIWSEEEIEKYNPILHSTELNVAYKNRNNPKISLFTKGAYVVLNNKKSDEIKKIYETVYGNLSLVIKSQKITTLCCIIDRKKFKTYYASNPKLIKFDDWYNIAMQEILEGYTHFLCKVNGVGSIMYEARDSSTCQLSSLDNKMFLNFCGVIVNGKGVDYLNLQTIHDRVRVFNIVTKKENSSGLQLADFIAFNYIKGYVRHDSEKTDFMKRIHRAAYNGEYSLEKKDVRSLFGMRVIPVDVLQEEQHIIELGKLKKAYENLKNERNRLNKKISAIKEEKHALEDKYMKAEEEYEKLRKEYEILQKKIEAN